jgi:O-succinylbenzoate synthase
VKFWIAPYQLRPRVSLNARVGCQPRSGVLLRFEFAPGSFGYSDLHPWPELGDAPLDAQIARLKRGEFTALTQRSYALAQLDAGARARGVSLWEGRVIPPSHRLIPDLNAMEHSDLAAATGIRRLKIKVGRDPEREVAQLSSLSKEFRKAGIKIRLDFNSRLSSAEFAEFLKRIDLGVLDFVEDPFPYHGPRWAEFQKEFGVRLALDRVSEMQDFPSFPGSYSVLVLKPASQDPDWICKKAQQQGASLVVTSSMDHPYGQLCAAWEASRLVSQNIQLEACGLLTHLCYEALSTQSEWTSVFGMELTPPNEGCGFGLDSFLESQNWEAQNVG